MKPFRLLIAFALVVMAACPARAAEAIFPSGLRIGLVPLIGLNKATSFPGFESEDKSVRVLMTELPEQAYGEVANAFKAPPTGTAGIKPESIQTPAGLAYYTAETGKDGAATVRRYSMIVPGAGFSGYVAVQIPEKATKIYSDDAVRQMFASVAMRKDVPVDEQLGLMPFRITELASFKNVRTLAPGAALMLADGDESGGFEPRPFLIIGVISGTPQQQNDRARFAQETATQIPGLRSARITMSEPIRVNGQPAYETRLDATTGKDNTAVTVVQWIRFGSSSSLRIIASAPRDQWPDAFPRFRAVRDGIQPRS